MRTTNALEHVRRAGDARVGRGVDHRERHVADLQPVRDSDEGLLVFFTYCCSALNVIVGVLSSKIMFWRTDNCFLLTSFDSASIAGVDSSSKSRKRAGSRETNSCEVITYVRG
jgi:hypothetical protein